MTWKNNALKHAKEDAPHEAVKIPKRIATRDIFPGIGTFVG